MTKISLRICAALLFWSLLVSTAAGSSSMQLNFASVDVLSVHCGDELQTVSCIPVGSVFTGDLDLIQAAVRIKMCPLIEQDFVQCDIGLIVGGEFVVVGGSVALTSKAVPYRDDCAIVSIDVKKCLQLGGVTEADNPYLAIGSFGSEMDTSWSLGNLSDQVAVTLDLIQN